MSYIDSKTYNLQEVGLAKELVRQGIEVSLIFPGKKKLEDHSNQYSVYYLPCRMLQQAVGYYKGLWATLDRIQPDIIQIHEIGMFMSLNVLLWSKRRNIPCVLIQGTYEPTRKPFKRILEYSFNVIIGKYILKHVNGIGCKTPKAAEYLLKYCHRQDMKVTGIGLDISKFNGAQNITSVWKEKLQIPASSIVLLYVGVIESRRHVNLLLNIIEKLPESYVLIIVGEGAQKEMLEQRSNEASYANRVKWLNKMKQEELVGLYKISDLFLLASDYEIYGMVILEAMYWKIPVLSTPTGGALALIKDNVNGFIINSFNSVDWRTKIENIFNNTTDYESIKRAAHNSVIAYLTWDHVAINFIHLYEAAIKNYSLSHYNT